LIFVSLGEAITERSGAITLGWKARWCRRMTGLCRGGYERLALARPHRRRLRGLCFGSSRLDLQVPEGHDIAIGIAPDAVRLGPRLLLGKPSSSLRRPLPAIPIGRLSTFRRCRQPSNVNVLFLIGAALAVFLWWAFRNTRAGLIVRVVGDSSDAAPPWPQPQHRAPDRHRRRRRAGRHRRRLSVALLSRQLDRTDLVGAGADGVALVIFARWNPLGCFAAALLFGGAGALGPALQSVGVTQGYYLFLRRPYILTLIIMIATSSPSRSLAGAPANCRLPNGNRSFCHERQSRYHPALYRRRSLSMALQWRASARQYGAVIIDMQTDFCGPGGYVDHMGYDLSLVRAPIEPIKSVLSAMRAKGYTIIHTREGHRPDLATCRQQALALAPHQMPASATRPCGRILVRGEPGWDIIPDLYRPRASRSSTSPARARSAPPTWS